MPLFLPSITASSVGCGSTTLVLSSASLLLLLPLAVYAAPLAFGRRCVHYSSTLIVPSCSLSALQTSCDLFGRPTSCCHQKPPVPPLLVCQIAKFPSMRLHLKVALPARTCCVNRQTISCGMSASGAVMAISSPVLAHQKTEK